MDRIYAQSLTLGTGDGSATAGAYYYALDWRAENDEPAENYVTIGACYSPSSGEVAESVSGSQGSKALSLTYPLSTIAQASDYYLNLRWSVANARYSLWADWPTNGYSRALRASTIQVVAVPRFDRAAGSAQPTVVCSIWPGSAPGAGQLALSTSVTLAIGVGQTLTVPPYATHVRLSPVPAVYGNTSVDLKDASGNVIDRIYVGPTVTSPGARSQIYDLMSKVKQLTITDAAADTWYVTFYIDPP
jgi:hypothetical protein